MQNGEIRPLPNAAEFTREAWCQLVASRSEFRRRPPRVFRNPFTGESMEVAPPADAAEVVVDGQTVGNVYWSMSEDPLVNVTIDPSGLPLVRQWAAAMGGEFISLT